MYVKRHYSLWLTVRWSRRSLINGLAYALVVWLIYTLTGLPIYLPWEPISVIGIAVAFYLGFKNNSSYDRTWEARKIWGAIVNDSRTFATAVLTLPKVEGASDATTRKHEIVRRHLAWLMALKHAMRSKRSWEHDEDITGLVFTPTFTAMHKAGVASELLQFISADEMESYQGKTNLASQLLKRQSEALAALEKDGLIGEYKQVWLHQLIGKLYDSQGMCERIKNFPLPRQYASVALWMNYVFCAMIPFGMLNIFEKSEVLQSWLIVPFSGIIIWVFFLMDRIGDYSENPFEGAYNDVPISSIARAIEIDLREMMNEENVPAPFPVENGFLM